MAMIDLSQTPAPFPQPQPVPASASAAEAIGAADAWGDQFGRGMVAVGAAALLLFVTLRR